MRRLNLREIFVLIFVVLMVVCLFCMASKAEARSGMTEEFEAPGFENPGWFEVVDEGCILNDQAPCVGPVGDKGLWCLDARSNGTGISKASFILEEPVDSSLVITYTRLINYAVEDYDVITPIVLSDSDGNLLAEVSISWVYPTFKFFAKYYNGSGYVITNTIDLNAFPWRRIEFDYSTKRGYFKCKVDNNTLCNDPIRVDPIIQELSLGVCYNDSNNVAVTSTALINWVY